MTWLARLIRRRKQDAQLDSELHFHVEQQIADNISAGMPPDEARRRALAQFGGLETIKEGARDARGTHFVDTLCQDVRYALRTLRKSPGFTAVAILTLALGIGSATAIFSIVNAVLLKSLSYDHADGLVLIQERIAKFLPAPFPVSAPDIPIMQRENRVFESVAAYRNRRMNLSGADEPQSILAGEVSSNLFPTLGASPLLGRNFAPEEDPPGHNVAILSYGLWQEQFGGGSQVIGKSLTLDAQPYTIIGVMRPNFQFPPRGMPYDAPSALWTPIGFTQQELSNTGDNFDNGVIARLKPGITLAQARTDMQVVAADVLKNWGPQIAAMGIVLQTPITPLQQVVVSGVRTLLYLLLAAVGFLLLIACANVANLLLSRAVSRQKEMTLRAALGARRGRIVRQLLTESVILALLGGAVGLLFAVAGTRGLAASAPDNIPQVQGITVDTTVLIFAILVSVITGVLFGLVPAFAAARVDLNEALKEGGRNQISTRRALRMRNTFVVAQVGIAFVLLIGGGLLVRSFVHAEESGAGVQPQSVVTATLALPAARYADAAHVNSIFQQIFSQLASQPGVEFAGAATDLPTEAGWNHLFTVENHPLPSSAAAPSCAHSLLLGNYFRALGVPLIAGRFFTPADDQGKSGVVIISAGMAKQYWPGESAVGKRIKWGPASSKSPWLTIVGIVGDVKQSALDEPARAHTYAPYLQACSDREMMSAGLCSTLNVAIRAHGSSSATVGALRSAVNGLDPSEPVTRVRTLGEVLDGSIAPRRFNTFLLSVFSGAALFLATIGLYSLLAYRVTQQTHEIGIRMALGAQRRDVLLLILGQGTKLALFGLGVGVLAAFFLARLMTSMLYGVSAFDPATFSTVAIILLGVALLACYIPARRALKVDPMVALRYE